MQKTGHLQFLGLCHSVLLVGSGPVPLILDSLQFQFTLGLRLTCLQNCWSVLRQPLYCTIFLCGQLWVNRRLRQLWKEHVGANEANDDSSEQHDSLLCEEHTSDEV